MFSYQNYDKDFFIDRPKTLAKIREWANATTEKQVLSIIAPPGWGKTWILQNFKEEWENHNCVIAWIHAPTLINRDEMNDPNRMINSDAFLNCFEEMQKTAKQCCPYIQPVDDENLDFSAMIGAFANFICDCNLERIPLVIVDGYDEITEKQAETFSLRLLAKLIEKRCIRLIIAHRVDWSVKGDSLRRNQRVLSLQQIEATSRDFALQQFDAIFRQQYSGVPAPTPDPWMKQLKEYKWDHALANFFLFQCGIGENPNQWQELTHRNYYECCRVIIERPDGAGNTRYPAFTAEEFKMLHRIAKELEGEWTQEEVQELLNINNFYINEITRKFFDRGLIVNVSASSPPYYQIIGGLCELLREMNIDQVQFSG